MKNKYWDIKIHIKNFSAKTALDSTSFKMINDKNKNIIFRRGKFNTEDIDHETINNYSFYDIEYIDVIPQTVDTEMVDMIEWFKCKKHTLYSILFTKYRNGILEGNIRFYSLKDAFEFRLQFNDYILFESIDKNKTITA